MIQTFAGKSGFAKEFGIWLADGLICIWEEKLAHRINDSLNLSDE